jgi:hypothetical protein
MKKIVIGVVCLLIFILVVVLTVNITKNHKKTEENQVNYEEISNMIGDYDGVKVEEGNIVIDDGLIELEVPISNNDIYEEDSDVGTTDKKLEAIELAKEKWGADETVSFRCDSVTSNGEYIIAVVSNETATVSTYFIVNLEKRTVEVDY